MCKFWEPYDFAKKFLKEIAFNTDSLDLVTLNKKQNKYNIIGNTGYSRQRWLLRLVSIKVRVGF